MDYVTVRGFEATGRSGRVVFGGSHVVVEHMYSHDIAAVGANRMLHGAVDSDGTETFGRLKDITIRNNLIERGEGEGIYVGGNCRTKAYGGWPAYGNNHSDVPIEQNTIRDAGLNGGEGDGIGVKTDLRNVTIRGNLIDRLHPMPEVTGIVCEGVVGEVHSDYLMKGNRISRAGDRPRLPWSSPSNPVAATFALSRSACQPEADLPVARPVAHAQSFPDLV